jgi:hypothetical protein
LCIVSSTAMAEERIVRLDDPSLHLEGSLYKSMDIRFSDSFAKGSLAGQDVDGMLVSDLPPGKICFQDGTEDPIDLDAPQMAYYARQEKGDFCAPLSEISVRFSPQAIAGAPPPPPYYIDKASCKWTWKTGEGIALWYEDCAHGGDRWNIVYDDALDAFVAKPENPEYQPYVELRQFRKAPDALLPDLKKAGLVLDTPDCQFQVVKEPIFPVPKGWTALEVGPQGRLKETFDARPADEIPEPPCGDLGLAVDYVGFYLVNRNFPDRVLFVDLGQDVSAMDLPSITLSP